MAFIVGKTPTAITLLRISLTQKQDLIIISFFRKRIKYSISIFFFRLDSPIGSVIKNLLLSKVHTSRILSHYSKQF